MNIKTLTLAAVTAVFSLSACGSTTKEAANSSNTYVTKTSANGDITKTLKLKNFNGINSTQRVVIHYTQGGSYKVTVSGRAETIAATDISVSNGTLVIGPKMNINNSSNGNASTELRLNITAPAIESIMNYGRMDFITGSISLNTMNINNSGAFSFKAGNMTNKSKKACFAIENYGRADVKTGQMNIGTANINNSGSLTFDCGKASTSATEVTNYGRLNITGTVESSSVSINNSGSCSSGVTYNVSESYDFTNYGSYDNNRDITAKSVAINNSGADTERCKLKADVLDIVVYGRSNYDINFSGGVAKLNCSGVGDFNLDVDCKSLNVDASGRVKVKLSGTADNTELTGSGISNVNTSNLNKF